MIKIKNLTFSYNRRGVPTLQDLSMELSSGTIYGLLGPNGAGKSTLLYLIAGLLTPFRGKITLNDVDTRKRLPETLSEIFIVPEEFELPAISLSKYVSINAPFYPRFSQEEMKRNLEMFGMEDNPNLGKLSMGQKKKVYMSFALACNTQVLLMDEPTNGLDIPGKSAFRRFIASNMNENRLLLISTHQVRDIDNMLDSVILMNNRQLICTASTWSIAKKLRFATTIDSDVISQALYSQPSVSGTAVVLRNNTDEPSSIDLEMFFQLATDQPQLIQKLLDDEQLK